MIIFIFAVLNEEQSEFVEKLFQEHHAQFQQISLKILNSEADAEDVVSSVYIKIIDNIEKISELRKYYKKNKGFFISISLICIQIISTIVFIYRKIHLNTTRIYCIQYTGIFMIY